MKRTKIVCTIGPASEKPEILEALIKSGMNVMRLNFSHGDYEEHQAKINTLRELNKKLNTNVAFMLDTKGPEIRTTDFADDAKHTFNEGDKVTLTTRDIKGDNSTLGITYKGLPNDVEVGGHILIDDGLMDLLIESIEGTEINCKVLNSATIKGRRGVNVPGAKLKLEAMTEKDKSDLKFGVENDCEFIAASFIRKAQDVIDMRNYLKSVGGDRVKIVSKIENQEGLDNFKEILEVSDGIMVARGDLGVEVPMQQLPKYQKLMIQRCREKGKFVIVATEMLESMKKSARPTRAEVSDVANAVLDGTDAVMLSGETTVGKFPVEVVRYMAEICKDTEEYYDYDYAFDSEREVNITETIANSVVNAASVLGIDLIIASTVSGDTARRISNLKSRCLILAATNSEAVARSLALNYAVYPTIVPSSESTDEVIAIAKEKAKEIMGVKEGDIIAITGGFPKNGAKTTNLLKIEQL